jgi:hypothetical protein
VLGQVYLASTYIEKYRTLPLHVVGPEKRTELLQNVEHHFAPHIDESGTFVRHFEESDVLYSIVKILETRKGTKQSIHSSIPLKEK